MRRQSSRLRWPERKFVGVDLRDGSDETLQQGSLDISKLKNATGLPARMEIFSAKLRASAVFSLRRPRGKNQEF